MQGEPEQNRVFACNGGQYNPADRPAMPARKVPTPAATADIPMILKSAVEVVVSIQVLAAAVQEDEAKKANSQTKRNTRNR